MFPIRCKADLFCAYISLQLALERNNNTKAKEIKRQIRAFNKRNPAHNIVKDHGMDGYIELIKLPDFCDNLENAEKYVNENYWIEPYYTYYDCTGRPFSNWIKVFKRNDGYYCYHSVSYDV